MAKVFNADELARAYRATDAIAKHRRRDPLPRKQDRLRVAVAAIADDLRAEMQTRQTVAHLSGYTIGKQKAEHIDLSPRDYWRIQTIMDGDLIFRVNPTHWAGFMRDPDGKLWAAVWKTTTDDREVLVVNFHRREERKLRDMRQLHGAPLKRK